MKALSYPLITTPLGPPTVANVPAFGWSEGVTTVPLPTRRAAVSDSPIIISVNAIQSAFPDGWQSGIETTYLRQRPWPESPAQQVLWEPPPPASTTTDFGWFDPTSRFLQRASQPPGPAIPPPGLPAGLVIVPPPLVPAGCVHLMDHRLVQSSLASTAMAYSILADRRLLQSGLSSTSLCE